MNQRYSELDAIRGIAALMVVLYHYSVRYGQIYEYPVDPLFSFDIGKYGVQLFFIVSGFVIILTLDKTNHAIDFIVSRFSRLYPAYWVAVILTFSIVYLFSLPGREVDIESALINMTMVQQWLNVANVDGVYWTLAVELSFYFFMFILFITKQLVRINLIAAVWLGIIIGCKALERNSSMEIHELLKLLFLLEYGNLFIAGIMFYKIMHRESYISYFILFICLITEYYLHGKLAYLITAYFFVFYLFVTNRLKVLIVKPLVYLGSISYSLYLIHQNVGYVVINEMKPFNILNPASIIMAPMALSLLLATLMQKYIERPSLVFIRNKWKESRLRVHLKG
jgi:peptidoglycan/LPS O-acetylase OafA/YrhL